MNYIGCGDNSCIVQRPRGMATNGGCRCPVVGGSSSRTEHTFEDRQRLRAAFNELNKEIKRLKAEATVKDSIYKQKVIRMETSLYNILANCKSGKRTATDEVNIEIATRGLSEPGGIKELLGKLKEDDNDTGTSCSRNEEV